MLPDHDVHLDNAIHNASKISLINFIVIVVWLARNVVVVEQLPSDRAKLRSALSYVVDGIETMVYHYNVPLSSSHTAIIDWCVFKCSFMESSLDGQSGSMSKQKTVKTVSQHYHHNLSSSSSYITHTVSDSLMSNRVGIMHEYFCKTVSTSRALHLSEPTIISLVPSCCLWWL